MTELSCRRRARNVVRTARLVLALVMLRPDSLVAQTTVAGVVRDSLSGRPFAGATVQLVFAATPWDTGRTVASDATGHFAIPAVAPGRYVLGFTHPRLDSLGLDAVSRALDVAAGSAVFAADLALPSGRTLAASLCGARNDSTGVLVGRVLDASQSDTIPPNGVVRIRWAELIVDDAGLRRTVAELTAAAGRDGRFVACAVPLNVPLLVTASAGDSSSRSNSGEIEISASQDAPLLHRDFLVSGHSEASHARLVSPDRSLTHVSMAFAGAERRTARLRGKVLTPDGSVLPNARVSVRGDSHEAVTDSAGNFRLLNLPAGTHQLTVIALGFAPTPVAVDLRAERDATVEVRVNARVPTLDVTTVYADRGGDRSGFYHRRDAYSGYFMTATDIERKGAFSVGGALIGAPSIHVVGTDVTGKPKIGGRFSCTPTIYLDGFKTTLDDVDSTLGVSQIGAIEVYANPSDAPAQFSGNCVVVLVWTKSRVP